jgi:hypothetical protein
MKKKSRNSSIYATLRRNCAYLLASNVARLAAGIV